MTTSTHLRQLPTLQPGDSHMESLIEAAIQGHADTREAMRWLVRQLVPATQPAEVTDEQIESCALEAGFSVESTGSIWAVDGYVGTRVDPGLRKFAKAILALRPVQAPMTDEVRERALDLLATLFDAYENGPACYESPDDCSGYLGNAVQIDHDTFHVIASLLNVHRPITAQADLWCIHIPGPDEVHAAPSKEAADHMAAKHNAAMATFYSSGAPNLEFAPSIENVQAVAIKWPYDQQSHADELREFDWSGWGLTKKDDK